MQTHQHSEDRTNPTVPELCSLDYGKVCCHYLVCAQRATWSSVQVSTLVVTFANSRLSGVLSAWFPQLLRGYGLPLVGGDSSVVGQGSIYRLARGPALGDELRDDDQRGGDVVSVGRADDRLPVDADEPG